jgi:hypothetical protein
MGEASLLPSVIQQIYLYIHTDKSCLPLRLCACYRPLQSERVTT